MSEINTKLETYEWDNLWIEHANKDDIKRVLYIGDSISCGVRQVATSISNGEIYFDGFGTSKALDNPYFKDSLHLFALQQGKREVVVFNNGLHGWHLDDEKEYPKAYEEMIKFLLEEFKGTPLVIVLSTYVANIEDNKRVIKRNEEVLKLAEKYNLPYVDYYSVAEENKDNLTDGVHFNSEGYKSLAEALVKKVKELI